MERHQIRTCIDEIRNAGRTPDKAVIASRLGVTAARVGEALKADPELNNYLNAVRAAIRSERRGEFARLERDAIESGEYVPFKEPQDLGRKVSPIDIAKNPRYQRD